MDGDICEMLRQCGQGVCDVGGGRAPWLSSLMGASLLAGLGPLPGQDRGGWRSSPPTGTLTCWAAAEDAEAQRCPVSMGRARDSELLARACQAMDAHGPSGQELAVPCWAGCLTFPPWERGGRAWASQDPHHLCAGPVPSGM